MCNFEQKSGHNTDIFFLAEIKCSLRTGFDLSRPGFDLSELPFCAVPSTIIWRMFCDISDTELAHAMASGAKDQKLNFYKL